MKIAMITADYLPNTGGITSHIVEISRTIVRLGHTVCVWHWDPNDRDEVSVESVPTELLRPESQRCKLWPAGVALSVTLTKVLREKIEAFKPEILHVHTLAPLSLTMRWIGPSYGYRRILTNHSSGYLNMIRSWTGRRKAKFYCGAFDGVLAPSQELLEKSRLLGLNEYRYRYIPNGVDPDKFVPGDKSETRSLLNIANDRFVLLATRRFAVKNGLRYLAEALDVLRREIPSMLCVFCGGSYDSEESCAVHKIVSDHGLKDFVRFEGEVPNSEIKHYLAACDVVVLPSLVEATSISGLEAMSASRPIVGTSVGGIKELVLDGVTGILVEPSDAQSLAEGIILAAKELNLKTLGESARQRVLEQFTWEKIARRTVNFYHDIQKLPPRYSLRI